MNPAAAAQGEVVAADASQRILLRWTIGLRWVLLSLLVCALPLGEPFFGFHVRYQVALPPLLLLALTNVWAQRRAAREDIAVGPRVVATVAAIDLAGIAVVLAGSGGAANPLSALFFVHVALAASLLPARTTFALLALATAMFASLFLLPSGACCPNHPEHGAFSKHLYGMLFAFTLSGGLVAYFLTRLRRTLDDREREIELLRRRSEADARFAALGTLAAGTAHELATPLGTIAVLAGEIVEEQRPEQARRHASSIAAQVERCREVIGKMRAGARATEGGAGVALEPVLRGAVESWQRANPGVEVSVSGDAAAAPRIPLGAADLEMAVCVLLDNARHASDPASGASIQVSFGAAGGAAFVRVDDEGIGVDEALRGRLGEPFSTTKEPGHGMGLGLYLVRKLLADVGGALEVVAREPAGTSVRLCFGAPVSVGAPHTPPDWVTA